MNIKRRIVLASLVFLISEANHAEAADVTWDGSQNSNWNQAKNWNPEAEPGASDTAIFAAPVTSAQPTVNKAASVLGVAFTGTGGWTIGSGNTLTVGTGGIDQTGSGLNTVAAAVALNGASTWTVSSGTLAVSGVVSGASALAKDGAGSLTLSGNNTYSGATTISGGTLNVNTLANGGANSSIGASGTAAANLVFNGGTLRYTGPALTTNRLFTLTTNGGAIEANGSGALTFGNAAAIAFSGNGARSLTLTGASTGNNTLNSIVGDGSGGATSLIKAGNGTWRLSGVNTYTGGTTIEAGTLMLTGNNRLSTSGGITVNGGTFDLGGFNQSTSNDVKIAGGVVTNGTVTKTAGSFAVQSGTASAVLAGAAGLTKTGVGVMLLNAVNSYSGGTTIEAGTLQFGTGADRLSTSGNITINGGTLNLGGFSQAISGNVTFAGGSVSNGTLTKVGGSFNAQSGSVSANAVLAGSGVGFQKTTGSVFTLNGVHTYTGATVIDAGTLVVNGSIANSSGVEVAAGATLGGHGTVSQISGAGTVSPGGSPGILTASSVNGSLGTDFQFEFSNAAIGGISTPDFLSPEDSGNDLLRITGATPFTFALTADNVITVNFSQVTLTLGDRYLGGFFTQIDSFSSISGAGFNYLGLGEFGVSVSMIEWSADFGGGPVNGFITQFEVIPEPRSFVFVLSAIGMGALLRRRRRLNCR